MHQNCGLQTGLIFKAQFLKCCAHAKVEDSNETFQKEMERLFCFDAFLGLCSSKDNTTYA